MFTSIRLRLGDLTGGFLDDLERALGKIAWTFRTAHGRSIARLDKEIETDPLPAAEVRLDSCMAWVYTVRIHSRFRIVDYFSRR